MRKILLFFVIGVLSFARSINETVAQIRKDYNATNSYKNYSIVTEPAEDESELEIKKYYKNGELRKVVTFGGNGRIAERRTFNIL